MQTQQHDNQQNQLLYNSQNSQPTIANKHMMSHESININDINLNPIQHHSYAQFSTTQTLIQRFFLVFVLFIAVLILIIEIYWNNILQQYNKQQQYQHIDNMNNIPYSFHNIEWLHTYQQLKKHNHKTQINNQLQQNTVSISKYNKLATAQTFKQYISNKMKQPTQDKQLQRLTYKYKLQLPICILINIQLYVSNIQQYTSTYKQILQSILTNNYTNYIIIQPHTSTTTSTSTFTDPKIKSISGKTQGQTTYAYYKRIIMQDCQTNALILLLNQPILNSALWNINVFYQKYNLWASFNQYQGHYQLSSFYQRVFQLVQLNDFEHIHLKLINQDIRYLSYAIIQLCIYHIKQISPKQLYKSHQAPTHFQSHLTKKPDRYLPLTRLSQDMVISAFDNRIRYNIMKQSIQTDVQIINTQNLSLNKMEMAIQYQDLLYLPEQHSLAMRQYQYYNSIYNISIYKTQNKQLPLCITILSHNNIQNNRYKKLMLSILQQQYNNYHIIFMDDVSTDQTLQQTIKFLQDRAFPSERVTFVRNRNRKYANYNILNAAFNLCDHGDVQVVIDGDDEIIGRYVFALINAAYQQHQQPWIVYTNFKTNLYQFGRSFPLKNQQQYLTYNKKRVNGHFLGQLRTWKTALIKTVPMEYHKTKVGSWLDTLYDDSIQHSIFQRSTMNKIKYISQICYQYNRQYGDNDDSSQQKVIYRLNVYDHILSLPALQPLQSLENASPNQQLQKYFSQQKQNNQFTIEHYQ